MRNFYFLSNLCKSILGSRGNEPGYDCRFTVGSPSGHHSSALLQFVSVVAILLTVGVGNVWGADGDNAYTLTFSQLSSGTNYNSYTASHSISVSSKTWVVYGNQSLGTYLGVGGNGLSGTDRTITGSNTIGKVVKQVKVNYSGVTDGKSSTLTLNSAKLEISGTSDFSKIDETVNLSDLDITSGNDADYLSFTPSGDNWASTKYYRFSFNCTTTGSKNSHFDITSIEFIEGTSCANSMTISKGTGTNCTFTLGTSGSGLASCSGVSTTVSITPTSGYGNPVVSQSGASAAPTITGTGTNSQTVSYAANTTGTSTINVSCSANTYTITLNKDLTPTTAGTASITATYNANTNLTSAITKPTKTGWTFGGYYTAKNGGGTQIIDASGNVIASVSGYTDASKNWKYVGNITLYAKWTCTVTWSVNGLTNVYSTQTVTYNSSGSKVASIPGPPSPASYCGDKFMGWTTEESVSQDDDTGLDLFTTVSGSPDIKSIGDITFYAVFADYDD